MPKTTIRQLRENMGLPEQIDRISKAYVIKDNVMKVNDNTFALPSQERDGKAHIVTIGEIELFRAIPNKLLVEASKLYDISNCCRRRSEFNVRVSEFLSRLSDLKIEDNSSIKAYDCTCEDHQYRPQFVCKHIVAVMLQEGEINIYR